MRHHTRERREREEQLSRAWWRDQSIRDSGLELLTLRPPSADTEDMEDMLPGAAAWADADGALWVRNEVQTGVGDNDLCERCGNNTARMFSVFEWGLSGLRCGECVRFIDGASADTRVQ